MKSKSTIAIAKLLAFFAMLLLVNPVYCKQDYVEKSIFGRIEEILIFDQKLKFRAKLDTGAKSSSLSANSITEFEFDGKIWVSFRVLDHRKQEFVEKKFPLKRYARIKQHLKASSIPKSAKRPVVVLPVCIGKQSSTIEVNLVDRSHFKYPVLLGRDALVKFNIVVDPAKDFTLSPVCEAMS